MPAIDAFPTAGSNSVEGKVQGVGPGMRDRCLTSLDRMVSPSDAATDAITNPLFKSDASQAPRIIESLRAERHVPEIVADALALQRDEGCIDIAKITDGRALEGNQRLTALPAAARTQDLGELPSESETVQIRFTHGHRATDLHLLESLPDAVSWRIGKWSAPHGLQGRKRRGIERQAANRRRNRRPVL